MMMMMMIIATVKAVLIRMMLVRTVLLSKFRRSSCTDVELPHKRLCCYTSLRGNSDINTCF